MSTIVVNPTYLTVTQVGPTPLIITQYPPGMPPVSIVVETHPLILTQIPGVGPPGPQGPPGPAGQSDLAALAAHIASETPHPFYDDQPSLSLIFLNRLV